MDHSSLRKTRLLLNMSMVIVLIITMCSSAFARPVLALPPAQVVLLTPANNSITYASVDRATAIPLFSWQPVEGATSYEVQISIVPGFNETVFYTLQNMTNTVFAPNVANLPNAANVYWHVRAYTGPDAGPWSATWTFIKDWKKLDANTPNAPVLLKPDHLAVLAFMEAGSDVVNRPSFSWQPVLGATHYKFELSRNPGFTDLILNVTINDTSYQPLNKPVDGTYYWRVTPYQTGSPEWEGAISAARTVTFSYNQAYRTTHVEPANQSFPTFTPTFRWTPVRGAANYILQYTTNQSFQPGTYTQIATQATSYTPENTIPNDVNYYWRVRPVSGASDAPNEWSYPLDKVWYFLKKWVPTPRLLTPTFSYPYTIEPIFSWTPSQGAASYMLEILNSQYNVIASFDTSNTFYSPPNDFCPYKTLFWQVTAKDASGYKSVTSPRRSYDCDSQNYLTTNNLLFPPVQFYPMYYYQPDPALNPHDDRTVALPMFMWRRVLNANLVQAAGYEIEVDDDDLFDSPWTIRTANLSAIPTSSLDLNPNVTYYWHVRGLAGVGPTDVPTTPWSQRWEMRFDPTLLPAKTSTITPLRPVDASEWVEMTPTFEWLPVTNADKYEIQISTVSDFSTSYSTSTVDYPAYSPLTRLPLGTYYWRVRGKTGATPLSWSATLRFQVASQSRWRATRTLGTSIMPVISSDPAGDINDANYDLTDLSITQGGNAGGEDAWYFRFNVNVGADKNYVIYIDDDHKEGSGGTTDPRGYTVNTVSAFRPEHVIYIFQRGGVFDLSKMYLYDWEMDKNTLIWSWVSRGPMDSTSMAGNAFSYANNTFELSVRGTNIGQGSSKNSLAVSVFSARTTSGTPAIDSVPSDPAVNFTDPLTATGTVTLSKFVSVSDRVVLMGPPNKAGAADPAQYRTIMPFFWQPPVETAVSCGYRMDVANDEEFVKKVYENIVTGITHYAFFGDLAGDNTYFWRIHPDYCAGSRYTYSQSAMLVRESAAPLGLINTTNGIIPEFSWDRMEGVSKYELQVDDDANFSSPIIAPVTAQLTYTPTWYLFKDGTIYYWHVRAIEWAGFGGDMFNDWSATKTFTVTREVPDGLVTIPETTNYTPTLCWNPVQFGYNYWVEISYDADFKTLYTAFGTEQPCYTPIRSLRDGMFYWRVKMLDGGMTGGAYSAKSIYNKEYPTPTAISPLTYSGKYPLFKWNPIYGASQYHLQVATDANFSSGKIIIDKVIYNTEANELGAINQLDYYWRVAMVDKENNAGPYTPTIHIQLKKNFLPLLTR